MWKIVVSDGQVREFMSPSACVEGLFKALEFFNSRNKIVTIKMYDPKGRMITEQTNGEKPN